MTLRELLDQATPGPWHAGIEDDREAYVFSSAPEFGWVTPRPHDGQEEGCTDEDARLIALAPELGSLVLDMADALRPLVTEDSFVYDGGNTRDDIRALLARLDRISTQTEREGYIPGGEPVASGCETAGSIPATSNPPAPCVCDPGDCGEDCGTA